MEKYPNVDLQRLSSMSKAISDQQSTCQPVDAIEGAVAECRQLLSENS